MMMNMCVVAAAVAAVAAAAMSPPGWTRVPDAFAREATKDVQFVLPVHNWDEVIYPLLMEVSTPGSPRYGQYLTPDQLRALATPACPPALSKYTELLGWKCALANDVWTCPGVPLADIEAVWDVRFATYAVTGTQDTRDVRTRATRGPLLPAEVRAVVSFVGGLGTTPPAKTTAAVTAPAAPLPNTADPYVTPHTFRAMYNVPDIVLTPNVSVGVVEYQDYMAYWSSDLKQFAAGLNIPACDFTHFHGPFNNESAGDESALDAAAVAGLACGAELHWSTFNNWIWDYAYFCASSPGECPDVSSHSWGWSEEDQCSVDSSGCDRFNASSCGYVQRVDQELGKSALLGKTHVFASGDAGCHGRTDEMCTNDTCHAVFPCVSRFGVCVSATAAVDAVVYNGTDESACQPDSTPCAASARDGPCFLNAFGPTQGCSWTPGGGISRCLARPWYQQGFVDSYLRSNAAHPPPGDFGTGRGVPDLAALGHNFWVVDNGAWTAIDGTSASTPLVAALFTVWNQARVNAGRPKLGLVAPLLYEASTLGLDGPAFTRVRGASNNCTEAMCCPTGFSSATTSLWDAVTGLGTPNLDVLCQL